MVEAMQEILGRANDSYVANERLKTILRQAPCSLARGLEAA